MRPIRIIWGNQQTTLLPPAGRSIASSYAQYIQQGNLGQLTPGGSMMPLTGQGSLGMPPPPSQPKTDPNPQPTLPSLMQALAGFNMLMHPSPSIGSVGGGLAGLAGGLGTTALMAAGTGGGSSLLMATGAVAKFAETLFTSIDTIHHWARSIVDANFQFAKYSGAMARVAARQQVYDIQREQRLGSRLAPSAEQAVTAREDYMNKAGEMYQGQWKEGFNKLSDWWWQGIGKISELDPMVRKREEEKYQELKAFAGGRPIDEKVVQEYMAKVKGMGRPSRFD